MFCCSLLLLSNGAIAVSGNEATAYHYSGGIEFEPERGPIKVRWQISVNDPSAERLKFDFKSLVSNLQERS